MRTGQGSVPAPKPAAPACRQGQEVPGAAQGAPELPPARAKRSETQHGEAGCSSDPSCHHLCFLWQPGDGKTGRWVM